MTTTTTQHRKPGRPQSSPNGAVKTGRHTYAQDAHQNDGVPVESCRKILAKFGVTLADVRAQARAAGTPWVVQDVQPGVVRYRYSQSARAKKEGVAK